MLKLYENIRDLRKANNWTQDDLARLMGYNDRSSIAKIESGVVDLPQSKILEFARVFHVEPGDLMGWDTSDAVIEIADTGFQEALKLYSEFQSLPPDKQAEFLNFLKFLQS